MGIDDMMYPGRPIPTELIEQYGEEFDALEARRKQVDRMMYPEQVEHRNRVADRLLSLRLPARREYITASEYNALIDAIAEVVG